MKKDKDKALDRLKRILGNVAECPMCHHKQFQLVEGYISTPIQPDLNGIQIGGPAIPSVAIICTRCGFISQHAVGIINSDPYGDDGSNQ